MSMPTTGKRKTMRAQRTLLGTGRLDLKISTVQCVSSSSDSGNGNLGKALQLQDTYSRR